MDLGPHTIFIVACYGITAAVIAGLIIWLWSEGARLKTRLAAIESAHRDRSGASDG